MDKPIDAYWRLRLQDLAKVLDKNGFEVFVVEDTDAARQVVTETILPATAAQSLSWGGSMSFVATGLYHELRKREDLRIIDTYDQKISIEEKDQRRREGLLVDLYITGTNAVTECGQLVNLDMLGNRVAALTYGPRHVIVFAGRNKITPDLTTAMKRVREYAAPVNSMRLDKQTPCLHTGRCQDCSSPERICNTWTITAKSFPKGRIKVVLVNRDLGF